VGLAIPIRRGFALGRLESQVKPPDSIEAFYYDPHGFLISLMTGRATLAP
jgi:hypothetical protein